MISRLPTGQRSRPQPRQLGRLGLWLQRHADAADAIGTLALLQAWIATALDLGASAGDLPRQDSFDAEAWLLDPEGNRVLLLGVPASSSPPGLAPRLSPGHHGSAQAS